MLKILLIEDNLSDARLTVRALKSSNLDLEISIVKDGIEALDFLAKKGRFLSAERPELIMLDLNLPRMDGHELLSILKSTESFEKIPVIVLSTSTSPVDRTRCLEKKAFSYLTKPMRYEEFSDLVEAVQSFCSKQL